MRTKPLLKSLLLVAAAVPAASTTTTNITANAQHARRRTAASSLTTYLHSDFVFTPASLSSEKKKKSTTLLETIHTNPVLSQFSKAIQQAQLEEELFGGEGEGTTNGGQPSHTVILPWDYAFSTSTPETDVWNKFMSTDDDPQQQQQWMAHLQNVVLCHIHSGQAVPFSEMQTRQSLSMMNGDTVQIEHHRGDHHQLQWLYFNEGQSIAYTETTDGIAYMTKKVLLPSFTSQPIMSVISSLSSSSSKSGSTSTSIFQSLLVSAGLDDLHEALVTMMSGGGQTGTASAAMTVFVPSNQALSSDPQRLAHWQSNQGLDDLQSVLLYHILPNVVVPSINVPLGTTQHETALLAPGGKILTITKNNDYAVMIINDQATVTSADHLAMDGIVHVIDAVLSPPTTVDDSLLTDETTTKTPTARPDNYYDSNIADSRTEQMGTSSAPPVFATTAFFLGTTTASLVVSTMAARLSSI